MKNCIFHSVACVDHYKNNNISQLRKKEFKHLIKNREQKEGEREREKKDQFSKR